MPDQDPFSDPSAGGVKVTDFHKSLLLLTPTEYREGITTAYGEKDAVVVDLAVLDGTESGEPETHDSRSEERRVGKECTIQCRSRWSPYH